MRIVILVLVLMGLTGCASENYSMIGLVKDNNVPAVNGQRAYVIKMNKKTGASWILTGDTWKPISTKEQEALKVD